MQIKRCTSITARIVAGLAVAALVVLPAAIAVAAMPPHVVTDAQRGTTDSCAICHRAHTADATLPYRTVDTTETTGTSLLIASDPALGDISLCYSCHGVAQLGSNRDVQSRFLLGSVHSLAPATAPYGPSPLYCSTCHDSHGAARIASDTPYPALLRSFEGTAPVYAGEEYCATCHTVQPQERWDGLTVYKATAHYTGMARPAAGAGIRCSICHDPHGSAVAPLLVASLIPTSAPTTFTVTADDRTFCIACHPGPAASWPASSTYAASGHGSSTATVPISARWVPGNGRLVGECQVCHASMGRSDGAGGAIPKLLDAKGRALCDRCHTAGGVASTDTSSQARPVAGAKTLAVVYAPYSGTAGRVSLYGRAAAGPGTLSGPRQYAPTAGTGPSAVGDVDGDGAPELVVASAVSPKVSIYAPDPLTGLSPAPTVIPIPGGVSATRTVVANIVENAFGWIVLPDAPEIAVVTADGNLVVYSYDRGGSVLVQVGSVDLLPVGPWGLTNGDVNGDGRDEAIATNASTGSITVVADDGLGGMVSTTTLVGGAPVAPSVGRVRSNVPAERQIVVCDAVSTTSTVRVFDGSVAELASYPLSAAVGRPSASAIGDVRPSVARDELAVAFTDEPTGVSSVLVVPQASGPGFDVSAPIELTSGAHTRSLLTGDVDGDGISELIAGNGGTWNLLGSSASAPSVQTWRASGSTLDLTRTYLGGGTELAGAAPALALADLGPVFPSRHPIDEVTAPAAQHNSTETAAVGRHVTCSDCHNTHESTQTAGVAPLTPGPLKGAWGVSVTYPALTFGAPARATNGYEVCFKCHSSYAGADLGGRPDAARQFDPANASVHAVSQASTSTVPAATFVATATAWTSTSVLYCTDCHGDDGRSGSQARGLHESDSAPILVKPYLGASPANTDLLCYGCHKYGVYATGSADGTGMSFFQTSEATPKLLHSTHGASAVPVGHGLSCSACHVSHGSVTEPHLLRADIGYSTTGEHAGSCDNACHTAPRAWPVP